MGELKTKYEASMRDVLHILGKYDYQYIKEYVEYLEKTFIQLEQNYDALWDNVHNNPPLKFEEIEVGNWYWDNKLCEYIKIEFIFEDKKLLACNSAARKFEENRFYRKQVEE